MTESLEQGIVRTAEDQQRYIHRHYNGSLDGMQIDIICYEPHTLSLRPFKFFFQRLKLIFTAAKLFHQVI